MSDRESKDNPTGLGAYFRTLNDIFALETRFLTGALSHYGERGRNDERRVAALLHRVLPRKYSLGTGFIISSHEDLAPSSQIDVVIHDQFHNSPLFSELAADVYPVEAVYGTVEVKADLSITELRKAARAGAAIRAMAKRGKFYAHYAALEDSEDGGISASMQVVRPVVLAPRTYVVGYDYAAGTPEIFVQRLQDVLTEEPNVFFNGVYAIRQNAFFFQNFRETSFTSFTEDGLLSFVNKLIADLQAYPMFPMAFSRYVQSDRLRAAISAHAGSGNDGPGEPLRADNRSRSSGSA